MLMEIVKVESRLKGCCKIAVLLWWSQVVCSFYMTHVLTFMTRINRQLLITSTSEASGGPTCSYLTHLLLMMLILWWCFLLLTHILCHGHSLKCKEHQYENTFLKTSACCNQCAPGERMISRCTETAQTVCKPCNTDFYRDEYSNEMECRRCLECNKEHMVYKVNCSASTAALCGCESGYECTGEPCTDCVKIPTTTTITSTTTATTTTTTVSANTISQDTVWITLSLCCVCILLTCFILVSRHIPQCGWIMLSTTGFFEEFKKTSAESSQCTEDEEVPMPVQEVCEHKIWQDEV